MPEVNYQVQTSYGDAHEDASGLVSLTSNSVYCTFTYWAFHRFININIPQGSVINKAYLILDKFNPSGIGTCNIYAEKLGNPKPLTALDAGATSAISSRARTTNVVAFNINVGIDEQEISSDISSVIQEIVNDPSWKNGNAINIILDGTGGGLLGSCSYEQNTSRAAILRIEYSPGSGSTAESGKPLLKRFLHKIYDKNGNYIKTWQDNVANVPKFRWAINGGMGEMEILLAESLEEYGEGNDVAFGNIVKTYIQDKDQERGRKIWEGKINYYEPYVGEEGNQFIRVRATSRMLEMESRIVRDASDNTTYSFASTDPTAIFKALINSTSAGSILKEGDMDDTDTTVTFDFVADTFRNAFQDILKISPQHWYWYLDADNYIHFHEANFEEIDHVLFIGKEVSSIEATKSTENLINRVLFMGGGSPNLYYVYDRTSSQSAWGLREKFMKDERVTVAATAQTMATRLLDDFDHPISEIKAIVLDSNLVGSDGYDIESLKPGDIVQIRHPRREYETTNWDEAYWDQDYWDFDIKYSIGQPHQIIEITYEFNKAVLRLARKTEDVGYRIEDIARNLKQTATQNIPNQPS